MYLVRRRGRETRAPVERCSMSAGMCSDTVDLYTLTGSTDNCAKANTQKACTKETHTARTQHSALALHSRLTEL